MFYVLTVISLSLENTKILVSGREKRNALVTPKGQKLEQVDSFTYLGSTITWDGNEAKDCVNEAKYSSR
jgi:hypothetical protein